MQMLEDVQFIPATGQPEYAVIPYPVYLELKARDHAPAPPHELIVGNPIKYWRSKFGLSQATLAASAHISIPYLSQLEHGIRVGSKAVLKRLADALHISIEQII